MPYGSSFSKVDNSHQRVPCGSETESLAILVEGLVMYDVLIHNG